MTTTTRRSIGVVSILLASLSLLSTTHADPQDSSAVKVIVHPDVNVSKVTQAEISRIFLGKKTFWESGARISPALLHEESPLTESFLEENLKKTVRQYRAYWKRHLFSGQGTAPKTFPSSKQVVDYVAATPGAIGIIDQSYNDDRVKVLELVP
jgi:ABC-type phosphate transport system substrate-binding protein